MPLRLIIQGKPISKNRPRFSTRGNRVMAYSDQKEESKLVRCQIMQEMRDAGFLRRLDGPLSVQMTFHTPIPKKTSQKRSVAILGKPDARRPDLDNYIKMYADIMNDLIYKDDNQITQLWSEKTYSNNPKVEIIITEIKEGSMINEHAETIKGDMSLEDLNYMVRKSNRLGLKNRELIRVFMEEDDEGKHYYFEVEGMKSGNGNKD